MQVGFGRTGVVAGFKACNGEVVPLKTGGGVGTGIDIDGMMGGGKGGGLSGRSEGVENNGRERSASWVEQLVFVESFSSNSLNFFCNIKTSASSFSILCLEL